MKDIRCVFGMHKLIHSSVEKDILREECLRCGKVEIIDIEETMEYLSKDYPEVVAAYREVRGQIEEYKQLRKCKWR